MSPSSPKLAEPAPAASHATIDSAILDRREKTGLQGVLASQPFWVTVALAAICVVMAYLQPDSFATFDNFFNITRNFSFIGIMALGMTAVIATGGIDLSVGSIMGLVAVVPAGSILHVRAIPGGWPCWVVSWRAGLPASVNGVLVAIVGPVVRSW